MQWRYYDDNPEGNRASLSNFDILICSSERPLKVSAAFVNTSSSLAALGSAAARARSRGRAFSDKDILLSPSPSLGGMAPGDCFIMLTLGNLKVIAIGRLMCARVNREPL